MSQFIIRRVMYSVVTLFILSGTIFLIVRLTGDPVALMAEASARPEDLERVRHLWGLDRSWPVQYVTFMQNALQGELGKSFNYRLPDFVVIAMHAFKNAVVPVFTLAGVNLVVLVNAAVIIEVIFAWPGIGRLLYGGIFQRDFPLVQGVVIMAGFMIVGINLVVDILYAFIDPRIRLSR